MKKEFIGKTICFLGDSITSHGHYLYNLRSYFHNNNEKCFVYNRGTGGNRVIMSQYILDDEIKGMNPDYVVVGFGCNDLGIWLYDAKKEITSELLQKRKARDDEYLLGYRIILKMIKERGITPIVMSPFAVDQLLVEREDIETLADNNEKEDYIGPSFYKRKTFENINSALAGYAREIKKIAQELGALYIPMHEQTYKKMLTERGMFGADGIHYTVDKGHAEIAKVVLEFLGCEQSFEFERNEGNDKIFELEQIERRAGNIRRATPYNPMFGNFSEEQIRKVAQELKDSPEQWRKNIGEAYLAYNDKIPEIREQIFDLTKKF